MTDKKEYNGWTNYETWRVNLEMIDGINSRDTVLHKMDFFDLAPILKEYCEETLAMEVPLEKNESSLVLSYALAFLNNVNWHEIARHMLEQYAEENA